MSFNDRCGEAYEILAHGGTLPDAVARAALMQALIDGRDYGGGPDREHVYAILNHPDNAALRTQTSNGQWTGEQAAEALRAKVAAVEALADEWEHGSVVGSTRDALGGAS